MMYHIWMRWILKSSIKSGLRTPKLSAHDFNPSSFKQTSYEPRTEKTNV